VRRQPAALAVPRWACCARYDHSCATPFATVITRLDEIPGLGATGAWTILAEIGLDMSRFPTRRICARGPFAPGVNQSAGKTKGRGATGHGNRYPGQVLGQVAVASARTSTFLGERCRRLARRRGGARATVAVGRSILVIIWHLLSQPESRSRDPGPGYTRRGTDPNRRAGNHVHQLEALGYTATLTPVA
jgi:transposase